MKKIITLSIWIVALMIGGALFWTSNEVQIAEQKNAELVADIKGHEERFAILSAEWHYLNSPAYLDQLATMAFKEEGTEDNKKHKNQPILLADSAALPDLPVVLLPVRKPDVPESFRKEQPIIVAEAKKVQSVKSSNQTRSAPVAARSPKQKEFSMILASWAE